MSNRPLPTSIKNRALWAIGQMEAFNEAIRQARATEALTNEPGRYEFDVRAGQAYMDLRLRAHNGDMALEAIEAMAVKLGWTSAEFFAALGATRPAPIAEGPQVHRWFRGHR